MELRLPQLRRSRAGTFPGKARTQAQVAISADSRTWFLLGASPDLRAQIEATPELHPREGIRQSPIAGAVLANADIDHVLGLLLLRELQPLRVLRNRIRAQEFFRKTTRCSRCCSAFPAIDVERIHARDTFSLLDPTGEDSGLRCRALSLGTHFPAYVSESRRQSALELRRSLTRT